jgi:hypothetical protein
VRIAIAKRPGSKVCNYTGIDSSYANFRAPWLREIATMLPAASLTETAWSICPVAVFTVFGLLIPSGNQNASQAGLRKKCLAAARPAAFRRNIYGRTSNWGRVIPQRAGRRDRDPCLVMNDTVLKDDRPAALRALGRPEQVGGGENRGFPNVRKGTAEACVSLL